jgi:hypothetical protein
MKIIAGILAMAFMEFSELVQEMRECMNAGLREWKKNRGTEKLIDI